MQHPLSLSKSSHKTLNTSCSHSLFYFKILLALPHTLSILNPFFHHLLFNQNLINFSQIYITVAKDVKANWTQQEFRHWTSDFRHQTSLIVRINLNVDKLLMIRTWASRSERLRGEPLAESTLSSPSLAGIHLEWCPPIPLNSQNNRLPKPWRAVCPCPFCNCQVNSISLFWKSFAYIKRTSSSALCQAVRLSSRRSLYLFVISGQFPSLV